MIMGYCRDLIFVLTVQYYLGTGLISDVRFRLILSLISHFSTRFVRFHGGHVCLFALQTRLLSMIFF